jgi:putative oxidoreductase
VNHPRPRGDTEFWVVRIGVALLFVGIGIDKFDARPNSEWVGIFARIGLGQWFRVATGWVEIAGGVLLLAGATRRLGTAILAATMLGAAVAHLTVLGDPFSALIPLVLGGIAVGIGLHDPAYDLRDLGRRGASASPTIAAPGEERRTCTNWVLRRWRRCRRLP